jgi:hypothetical protein
MDPGARHHPAAAGGVAGISGGSGNGRPEQETVPGAASMPEPAPGVVPDSAPAPAPAPVSAPASVSEPNSGPDSAPESDSRTLPAGPGSAGESTPWPGPVSLPRPEGEPIAADAAPGPASTSPGFATAAVSAEWDVLAPVAPTGDERVDTALALLDDLRQAPVVEHVPVYDEVQRRLQDVLADIDDEEPA